MLTSGLFSSTTPEWATPQELYNALDAEFHFELDPCATEENHKAPLFYTKAQDGLAQDWGQLRTFINPPYGRAIGRWVRRAREHAEGGGLAVALLPCRTDTQWWGDVMKATEIRFIKGRVRFGGASAGAPFPSCIVIWGTPRAPVLSMIDRTGARV